MFVVLSLLLHLANKTLHTDVKSSSQLADTILIYYTTISAYQNQSEK